MNTPWTTSDLWLRRSFDLESMNFSSPHLKIFHDDEAEVYVNGALAGKLAGSTSGYLFVPLSDAARATLRAGANTIAIHVHQERGGQFIDAGLVDVH